MRVWVGGCVALAMVLTACGDDDGGNSGTGAVGAFGGSGGVGAFGGIGGVGAQGGIGGVGAQGGIGGVGAQGGTGGVGAQGGTGGVGGEDLDAGVTGAAAVDADTLDSAVADSGVDANMTTDAGNTPPDEDCVSDTFGGHKYWFCDNTENWEDARDLCQAVGGDLVSINTEPENTFLEENIEDVGGTGWWYGLQYVGGEWQWVDGTDVTFDNWGTGEPDTTNDCGARNDDEWRDWSCTWNYRYVCEID